MIVRVELSSGTTGVGSNEYVVPRTPSKPDRPNSTEEAKSSEEVNVTVYDAESLGLTD